ncbi:MAG: hypothetical protein Kow0031_31360 [Anaerolineae bacterium]
MENTNHLNAANQPHFAAEFDYFRLPPEKWPLFLARLHQLGLTTLSLTVPWQLHQPTPTHVDFNSRPRHNLPALLRLCATLGFGCIVQPGPLAPHHGLLNRGLPHWLTAPPDIFDAAFRQALSGWLDALSGALAPLQHPAGPVMALALTFADDAPGAPLSQHVTEVRWPIWLRKKYHGLEALNAAHRADYPTVNAVPLPPHPAPKDDSPLAADARAFLAEIRNDSAGELVNRLRAAGWTVPLYPFTAAAPPLRPVSALATALPADGVVVLQQPIQAEPDPPDIAAAPAWATRAPLRADGSPRRAFRRLRQQLQPAANGIELLDAAQDTDLKLALPKGSRPQVFTLYFSGELAENTQVSASRGRLKGPFLLEDHAGEIDRLLCLNDPAAPLPPATAAYLQRLLALQRETLLACARQADALHLQLTGGAASPRTETAAPSGRAAPAPTTITEARRGLHQAEAALKKAMASLGGLESGFDSILQRGQPPEAPQPGAAPAAVSAAAFDGPARDSLLRAAEVCAAVATPLKTAASTLTAAAAPSLTLAEYRQNFESATHAAREARRALLPLLELLRLELASEQLPLVAWRVHQQLLHLTELLRWGVLRR